MNGAETLISVPGVPLLHSTPLARVIIGDGRVTVELDDVDERRIELRFEPFQAAKVVTADCYVPPGESSTLSTAVLEVMSSRWIARLKERQGSIDETARFMDRARHFVVPLQDEFLEVVAWEIVWEPKTGQDHAQAPQ